MARAKSLKYQPLRRKDTPRRLSQREPVGHNVQQLLFRKAGQQGADVADHPVPASYRLALKSIRKRALVSVQQAGDAIGLSATGYQRYENDKQYDHSPIPYGRVISGLMTVLVGKGSPPITESELINISDMREERRMASTSTPNTSLYSPEAVMDYSGLPTSALPFRYIIERGVYRDTDRVAAGVYYGTAPIYPLTRWPQDKQWACRVNGLDGLNYRMPNGTILHCLDPDAVPGNSFTPGMVVIAARERAPGMTERLLARIVEFLSIKTSRLRDSDGQEFTGEIVGLPLYQYGPVNPD